MHDNKFLSPLSFVAVFGSGIRDPGRVQIRIRDKHPGSATLYGTWYRTFSNLYRNKCCGPTLQIPPDRYSTVVQTFR
jgi:hypothetical protein